MDCKFLQLNESSDTENTNKKKNVVNLWLMLYAVSFSSLVFPVFSNSFKSWMQRELECL